ncbi:MAG: penicillin-binding protein 2 [Eubacterium sp.]|nr:penicillin-binding protein 2 [Eubacterium sp.]
MKRKLVIVFAIILLALIVLILRVSYINAISGEKYAKTVLSQQDYDSTTIPYKRGNITDRNGTVLATSTKVYNLILDSKVLNANEDCIDDTIDALVKYFDLDEDELRTFVEDNPTNQYKVLLKKLTFDEISDFKTLKDDLSASGDADEQIKGVWFEEEYERTYPYGSLAASLIGFVNNEGTGTIGIESYYNSELTGVNGREYGYLNSDSNLETTVISAEDGNTVVSTIDSGIQSIVEKAIVSFNNEHANSYTDGEGSANTAVIVMDPDTGEILAMANYPTFDLNNPRDLSDYYTDEELEEMTDDEIYDLLYDLWSNYCVSSTYEPGSTIKPFTVATALETGVCDGSETYYCDGHEYIGGYEIKCSHTNGHGTLTLGGVVAQSCNDAIMQIAMDMGKNIFSKYQGLFNFGLKTGIDLPAEARTDSLIYDVSDMGDSTLATNAFGQNFNVTMVQLASGFSSLINGGYYYKPHVVKEIQDSSGNTVETIDPVLLKKTVSEETSELMREYLGMTVTEGTATALQIEGYSMGGKTGTAEKLPRDKEKYLVSFIGFAPVDDPEVVVYVVIDEPNDENQAQSGFAISLAKEIFAQVLPYMNIFPDNEDSTLSTIEDINEYLSSDSLISEDVEDTEILEDTNEDDSEEEEEE